MENNSKGNGIFLGVLGVATLVVAIIGATFAYFSASATSGEDAIQTQSTSVALGLQTITDESVFSQKLIPAYDNIAKLGEAKTTNRCKDDNENEICSVYTFMIGNPSASATQKVYGDITIQTNSFDNLYFRIYDITDGTEKEIITPSNFNNAAPVKTADGQNDIAVTTDSDVTYTLQSDGSGVLKIATLDTTLAPSKTEITGEAAIKAVSNYELNTVNGNTNVKKFKVVIWLRDTGFDQSTTDTLDSFIAGVNFTTGTGTGVTGVIGATTGENFAGE